MKNYMKNALLLMLLAYVSFTAGYIYNAEKTKLAEMRDLEKSIRATGTYIWPE